jgi:hypothetical protein
MVENPKRKKFYENVAPDRAAQNVRGVNKLTTIRPRRIFIS